MPLEQGIDAVPTTVCAYANHCARRRKRLFALAQIQTEHSNRVLGGCTLLKSTHPIQTLIFKGLNKDLGVGCWVFLVFLPIEALGPHLSGRHGTPKDRTKKCCQSLVFFDFYAEFCNGIIKAATEGGNQEMAERHY